MDAQDRIDRAARAYEQATFSGISEAIATGDLELDHVEAQVALARGRIAHARFLESRTSEPGELALFERAVELFIRVGDVRGQGEAMFWTATYHQVVLGDHESAEPLLLRAEELATVAGDPLTRSYVLRHLAFVDHAANRISAARARMEESTRLRRDLGFLPGVAANLIGLAYLADPDSAADESATLLDEATELATQAEAHGVLRQIAAARTELGVRA